MSNSSYDQRSRDRHGKIGGQHTLVHAGVEHRIVIELACRHGVWHGLAVGRNAGKVIVLLVGQEFRLDLHVTLASREREETDHAECARTTNRR
jgi:hypothetical protein